MNPVTYGGDEISALILDLGTSTTRVGFAGEDTPRRVFPTSYGWVGGEVEVDVDVEAGDKVEGEGGDVNMRGEGNEGEGGRAAGTAEGGDIDIDMDHPNPPTSSTSDPRVPPTSSSSTNNNNNNAEASSSTGAAAPKKKKIMEKRYFVGEQGVNVWREGMEVGNMMRDGIVSDPAPLPHILHHALSSLHIHPPDHPLLVTEPAWNSPQARELLAECAFEGEGVPAFYVACASVLSAFAAGKGTALVVEIGTDLVSVVPIVDGYAIRAGTKRQPLSLTLLHSQILHHLRTTHPSATLTPHSLIKSRKPVGLGQAPQVVLNQARAAGTTESYRKYWEGRVVEGWREGCSEIAMGGYVNDPNRPKYAKPYEFPDGYNATFGEERYRITESLFNPDYIDKTVAPPDVLYTTPDSATSHPLSQLVGLGQLIYDSIYALDVDVRHTLLANIVLCGPGSSIPGLADRLNSEVSAKIPGGKLKIHASGNSVERKYSAWLGGSILASLGTFQQLWVAKEEWYEHGPAILAQRCK